MVKKVLFVDFENVPGFDLVGVGDDTHVVVLVGSNQKNVPFDLVQKTQPLGRRLEWKQVDGNGKNALDFFIAYHLGKTLERDAGMECLVLSRDKGFDPLLRSLRNEGRNCKRVESLSPSVKIHSPTKKTPPFAPPGGGGTKGGGIGAGQGK